jgi:2'-5' RNA ligase
MLRLFIGVPLPPAQKLHLSAICCGLRGARWIDPGNYHVTLRFIGEVDEGAAGDIDLGLSRLKAKRFSLTVAGIGAFGTGNKPHLLYAGIDAEPGLLQLHDKVGAACSRLGLVPDRNRYVPHVTLAKVAGATAAAEIAEFTARNGLLRLAPFAVESFSLIRSYLTKSGSIYEDIAEYPLN